VDETRAAAAHDRGQNRPLWKTVLPTVAGLTVTGLVCVGWVVWDWYIGHSPRDLTPDRARVRLVELLDRVYHVGLDPSARVVAAHTARPTYQDEGSDWYLLRLDPARAAQFEADLVARTSGSFASSVAIDRYRFSSKNSLIQPCISLSQSLRARQMTH